jgi:hypothetical protein
MASARRFIVAGAAHAEGEIRTPQVLQWEVRLTSGATLLPSALRHAADDVLVTHEAWKAAMVDTVWC